MRTGDLVVPLYNAVVRGVSGELEDENWRLAGTTPVRGGDLREVKNLQKKGVPARQNDIQRETHTL